MIFFRHSIEEDFSSHPSTKLLWRILNGIGCLFFLFAAGVNCNDSDWYLWVPIYLSTSIILALECFNYRSLSPMLLYVNGFLFCLILAFGCHFLYKYQLNNDDLFLARSHFLEDEQGRELSGLALASAWLFLILLNRFFEYHSRLSFIGILCGSCLSLLPVGLWSVCYLSNDWRERFPQCQCMFTSSSSSPIKPSYPTF